MSTEIMEEGTADRVELVMEQRIEPDSSEPPVDAAAAPLMDYSPPTFNCHPSLAYEEHFPSFTKGVKWSRSGNRVAVCTDDRMLHLKEIVETSDPHAGDQLSCEHISSIKEAQPIHDFAWHPSVDRNAIVTTCNTQPLHLYDGIDGKFICSYVARNHLDEHISAYCLQFTKSGTELCGGYKKFVRIFDVERPGIWQEIPTWKLYQAGIVSAIDTNNDHLLAAGTYCNTVAVYDMRSREMVNTPEQNHEGGITQLRFSYDGNLLYSAARRDNSIVCRDMRNFDEVLHEFPRKCETNQRIHFDLPYEENYLCTGNTDGTCFIWNLRELNVYEENKCRPSCIFLPHSNESLSKGSATNGVSFHPWKPWLATSSGGREKSLWDDEKEECVWEKPYEYCLKVWRFHE